jgi:potassium/hydrogen antiporter
MFLVDFIILISGVMLLLGIASSKLSARLGVPVLVLFLLLGMLAGSEGIGGIEFENYSLAHGIGTIALAFILFDGGLSTPLAAVRTAWKPSLALATLGVLITALLTGLAASWILKMSLLEGILLGSIVGSTDAAAVFAVLRSGGVKLPERLGSTLEIESGSNDPMAIFMTIGCIEVLTGRATFGADLVWLFASQMIVGAAVGLILGLATVKVVNRINLDAAGLYPVLVSAFGLLIFGLAARLGGSGFLAVYLAGIVIGNSRLVFQRGIMVFHDAAAWLSQILMFVILGLLSFPSRLLNVSGQGLLIGAVLILVARPIAVLLSISFFRFSWRELLFVSWVGLKGAVPITLATFPLLLGVAQASLIFDVVFFVVVLSALIQGWSLPVVARWLNVNLPPEAPPPVTLELSSLRHVEGDIVDYTVSEHSRAAGRRVRDLSLPEGVVIALIARDEKIIPPDGNTTIEAGDHVVLVLRPGARTLVNRVFAMGNEPPDDLPFEFEYGLRGTTTVGVLEEMYDIHMDADSNCTLDELLRQRLGDQAGRGRTVRFGQIALRIRHMEGSKIDQVGMSILPDEQGLRTATADPQATETDPSPPEIVQPAGPDDASPSSNEETTGSP